MNGRTARKKVVVLGGGIAGMSAAQELVERGFDVEVFERKPIPGGKARSIATEARPRGARPALPGEHGFRFFPRFYKHVVDTMARIPFGAGSVAENLVDTTRLQVARFDRPSFELPARCPMAPDDIKVSVCAAIALLAGQIGVPLDETIFFAEKMWRIVTSCEERRLVEYERINWWDFIEAGNRSLGYQTYFGSGITRSLVAAKARRASTKTIGDVFMQIVFDIVQPGISADRVLNGPTSDVWIDPWLQYLRQRGVVYHLDADVRAIHYERGVIRGATVAVGNRIQRAEGDYFIAALPVERMAELVTPTLLSGDRSLANLSELTEYVEWMNGIQFYLTEDAPIAHGHTIYVDTPWALTSISQPQFWGSAYDLAKYGDGKVRGLLSVDISDWDVKGLNGKEARKCARDEVAAECWEQLKKSLNVGGNVVLRDDCLHSWFLDPDLSDGDRAMPGLELNAEPLLVNYVDTWRLRPEATTRIPNFFLASDYVRTYTDLATMEAANEAARRAVNGVLRAAQVDAPPCAIWNLHEPEIFLPLRAHDRMRFRRGLPWDGEAMALARSALEVVTHAKTLGGGTPAGRALAVAIQQNVQALLGENLVVAPDVLPGGLTQDAASGASPPPGQTEAAGRHAPVAASSRHQAATAAAARSSSDDGLRQLRVVG